ncbi:MAG: hypothetical protein HY716_06725 [Planctomycetes bacterium]|nr:hypothetical protein [Planctomycetota bacterium]
MKYATLLLLAFLTPSLAARADEVRLKNGGHIVGIAEVRGDQVTVEMPFGTATIPKTEVLEITPGRTILHEYREKYAKMSESGDATGFYELALWAEREGVSRHWKPLLQRVLALDPDHAGARGRLGYVLHDGRWITKTEYLIATGHVEFHGRWMKPEVRDAILTQEAETRLAEREHHQAPPRRSPARPVEYSPYPFGIPSTGYTGGRAGVWGGGWYPGWYWWPYEISYHGVGWESAQQFYPRVTPPLRGWSSGLMGR